MKHLFWVLILLQIPFLFFAQHSNNKKSINSMETKQKSLVAFFSRADENYAVGYIEKGNTHIVAEMIAAETGADLFHIETVKPYPADYTMNVQKWKSVRNSQKPVRK